MSLSFKAIGGGLALFLAILLAHTVLLVAWPGAPSSAQWLPYVSVVFGAALTGYLLNARLFANLTALSLVMVAMLGILNLAMNALGHATDFPGMKSSLILLIVSFPLVLVLAYIGGSVGNKLNGS